MKLYKLIICVLTLILSLMITSCNSSVTLDEWNENATEWYNKGIKKGMEMAKKDE
mgnify:CR=1 FL=1